MLALRQNILVIGATGFTGSRLIDRLRERTDETFALLVRDPRRAPSGFTTYTGDLDDPESLKEAFKNKDGLICLAPLKKGHAQLLLNLCQAAGIRRALFVSTTDVFTLKNIYQKVILRENERLITTSTMDWTILRPTMLYGAPDDHTVSALVAHLRRRGFLWVPNHTNPHIQPVHVDDMVQAVVNAFFATAAYRRAYTLSGKIPMTFHHMVEMVAQALGRKVWLKPVPAWVFNLMLHTYGRFVYSPALVDLLRRMSEAKPFDHEAAARDIGFHPRRFENGLKQQLKQQERPDA